jgi:hypothetical protein
MDEIFRPPEEMHRSPPVFWKNVVTAFQEEDIRRAACLIAAAIRSAHSCPLPEEDAGSLREAFFGLLERRGYFIHSPAEIQQTVHEIRAVGSGFDLFDLAQTLAEYDMIATECLGLRSRRLLPELRELSPACPCGKHPPSEP